MVVTTLSFRSNINCEECVKKVSPFLDEIPQVYKWVVNFASQEKLLSVTGENIKAAAIRKAVEKAGYKIYSAQSIFTRFFSGLKKSYRKDCCG